MEQKAVIKAVADRIYDVYNEELHLFQHIADGGAHLVSERVNAILESFMAQLVVNFPRHNYWAVGDKDCPKDIKAGNGELHTLRCKNCGEDNPKNSICLASINPRVKRWAGAIPLIERLTDEEGAFVSITGPNPDFNGLPNECVTVCRGPFWKEEMFRGETLAECLKKAIDAPIEDPAALLPSYAEELREQTNQMIELLTRKAQVLPAFGSGNIRSNANNENVSASVVVTDDGKRPVNPDGSQASVLLQDLMRMLELTLSKTAPKSIETAPEGYPLILKARYIDATAECIVIGQLWDGKWRTTVFASATPQEIVPSAWFCKASDLLSNKPI